MPRIPFSLIHRAHHVDPLLVLLLRECRDLHSAKNELRWLTEYVNSGVRPVHAAGRRMRLKNLVKQRARGTPLQYILGDQPFGELDILCKKGVLIPRPETESYTSRIAGRILSLTGTEAASREIRILDLCTGTGCIPLLLHSLLAPSIPNLSIVGVDISPLALSLANKNLEHNIDKGKLLPSARKDVKFIQANILDNTEANVDKSISPSPLSIQTDTSCAPPFSSSLIRLSSASEPVKWDLLISNPPYISPQEFRNGTTKRSVRLYEPTLALVPPPLRTAPGTSTSLHHDDTPGHTTRQDSFYPRLLSISRQINARLTVLECGDLAQAQRVTKLAHEQQRDEINSIRDDAYNTSSSSNKARAEIWSCDTHDDYEYNNPIPSPTFQDAETGLKAEEEEHGPAHGARAVVITRNL